MMLDGVGEEEITGIDVPTGVPLLYELDENLRPVGVKKRDGTTGVYLGSGEEIEKRIKEVKSQTK